MPEIEQTPLILRPAAPVSEMIVRISFKDNILQIRSDFNADLVMICKRSGYWWERPFWKRRITRFNGTIEDRLIEIAYTLLSQNFIIEITSDIENLAERIQNGDYADEQTRWITKRITGNFEGWFAISWNRRLENFYTEARKLASARWSKPAVVVKPEYYEEVIDFAEINDFQLSDGARELIAEAENARQMAVRVELKPRKQKAATANGEITKIGEIAEELLDTD